MDQSSKHDVAAPNVQKVSIISPTRQQPILSRRLAVESTPNDDGMVIAFVNMKSGSASLHMDTLRGDLSKVLGEERNGQRVFDLTKSDGPRGILESFVNVNNLTIIVCGGDGTVAWTLNEINSLYGSGGPAIAIIPFGTGNDMSRHLNWGSCYSSSLSSKILCNIKSGSLRDLDRWQVVIWHNNECRGQKTFYNYFSIGADAEVVLRFDQERQKDPQKFTGRICNMITYGKIYLDKVTSNQLTFQKLNDKMKLWVEDVEVDPKNFDTMEAILLMNIDSYAAGSNPWRGSRRCRLTSERDEASSSDGKLEITSFRGRQIPRIMLGKRSRRLCQARNIRIDIFGEIAYQIDGEPGMLPGCTLIIQRENQARVIAARKRRCGCSHR